MKIDEVWELINKVEILMPVRCGKTEFWTEVLRRACVLDPVGYKPMRVEIPRGKILTDLYKHEKWEIPFTDEWVKHTILNYLRKYDEYYDKNGNQVHFIRRQSNVRQSYNFV